MEATVNLIASLILVHWIGLPGIFLGTLISTMTVDFWVEPLVLFRHGFCQSTASYFKRYAGYTILTFASGALTYYLCSFLGSGHLPSFVGKCFICAIVPNLLYFLIFRRTSEFQYLKSAVPLPAFLKARR